MNSTDPLVLGFCDGYKRAIHEKDVEAFLGLYDPEARVFDTWGVWSYEGVGERRQIIEKWFASLGEERVRVSIDRIRAVVVDGMATISARVIYAALSTSGEELRSMQNRLTWVVKPEGGTWRIFHEHTSVPIGFNDLKGMLQRE